MKNLSRFERHIDVPEIGLKGQEKIMRTSALIVGIGGLGCPAALYLAAAGMGTLGIADNDTISISNLQRQVLYTESDVGLKKTEVAKHRLQRAASSCNIRIHDSFINESNMHDIVEQYDIVVDCSDNFATRFSLNKACHDLQKKLISASLHHHDGQISVFKSFEGASNPCYECLFPRAIQQSPIPACTEAGIVGPVAGILGTMQASAVINEVLDIGESLSGWLILFSALTFKTQKIKINKKTDCPICAQNTASAGLSIPHAHAAGCAT